VTCFWSKEKVSKLLNIYHPKANPDVNKIRPMGRIVPVGWKQPLMGVRITIPLAYVPLLHAF
jgi:hypothetical protein